MTTRLTLHIDDPTPEWLALAAAQPAGSVTAEPYLTAAAATRLIELITQDAAFLLKLATDGDGRALGADFRTARGETRLNGATTSIARTINSLTRQGIWPAEVGNPLTSTTAGKEGWSKTYAYHLDARALPAFREAFARVYPTPVEVPEDALTHLAEIYEQGGREPEHARERAEAFFEQHADALTTWALARNTTPSVGI
ncbi:hypothetical protein [Streptomyces sp. NPDC001621]|uniref:hypothetical protein n=1 Tax=Streptomyces sp. NPDC001621 TaxID=3364594 RepID=UPI0036C8F731